MLLHFKKKWLRITTVTAKILHASRSREDFTHTHTHRVALSQQRVLSCLHSPRLRCPHCNTKILLWPWNMQLDDGYYNRNPVTSVESKLLVIYLFRSSLFLNISWDLFLRLRRDICLSCMHIGTVRGKISKNRSLYAAVSGFRAVSSTYNSYSY